MLSFFNKFNLLKKKSKKRKAIGKLQKKTIKTDIKTRKKSVMVTSKYALEKQKEGKLKYENVLTETQYRTTRTRTSLKCWFCSSRFAYTRAYFQHVRYVHVAPIRKKETRELNITKGERRQALSRLYPPNTTQLLYPKKKYVCAVCKSVCYLYVLFLHMKQVIVRMFFRVKNVCLVYPSCKEKFGREQV